MELCEEAVARRVPHAQLYYCQALLDSGFGYKAAEKQLDEYYRKLGSPLVSDSVPADPFLLFVVYQLHKTLSEISKTARLRAAAALASFRCFPDLAAKWLSEDDNLDIRVSEEGLENSEEDDKGADFDDEVSLPANENDPGYQWNVAKEKHNMVGQRLPMLTEPVNCLLTEICCYGQADGAYGSKGSQDPCLVGMQGGSVGSEEPKRRKNRDFDGKVANHLDHMTELDSLS
jgi:hypothetical protein